MARRSSAHRCVSCFAVILGAPTDLASPRPRTRTSHLQLRRPAVITYPQQPMKLNRTQIIGALRRAALVLLALLLRYWKFSG